MAYLLALPAIALPAWLITQVVRGRMRVTCCGGAGGTDSAVPAAAPRPPVHD